MNVVFFIWIKQIFLNMWYDKVWYHWSWTKNRMIFFTHASETVGGQGMKTKSYRNKLVYLTCQQQGMSFLFFMKKHIQVLFIYFRTDFCRTIRVHLSHLGLVLGRTFNTQFFFTSQNYDVSQNTSKCPTILPEETFDKHIDLWSI